MKGDNSAGRGWAWWDRWFLGLARHVSTASKDPSTKAGAVVVDPARRLVSVGYNGFPRGVRDLPERYADRAVKLRMVVHAESNALLFAKRDLTGCTLYTWPFMSCASCAALVVQSGMVRCVAPVAPAGLRDRWGEDMALARLMFAEAGVALDELEDAGAV